MEIEQILRTVLGVGILLGMLAFMAVFLVLLLSKATNHAKLLKLLFPEKLKNFELHKFWDAGFYKLNADIVFWYYAPLYYTKVKEEDMNEDALFIHRKLKRVNKQLLLLLASYFLIFAVAFLGTFLFGGE